MRARWIPNVQMEHILAALEPMNKLACEVCLATGLRIGDVLQLKTDDLKRRFTIYEQKTGKRRSVYMPKALLERCRAVGGRYYVFQGRNNAKTTRTRQAVYKDLKRAVRLFRAEKDISVHSLRKMYAVDLYKRTNSLEKVQHLLNHSSEAVTLLYALADVVSKRR